MIRRPPASRHITTVLSSHLAVGSLRIGDILFHCWITPSASSSGPLPRRTRLLSRFASFLASPTSTDLRSDSPGSWHSGPSHPILSPTTLCSFYKRLGPPIPPFPSHFRCPPELHPPSPNPVGPFPSQSSSARPSSLLNPLSPRLTQSHLSRSLPTVLPPQANSVIPSLWTTWRS